MASEIIMPKLSDTMTEGRFGVWKKSVGDRVERGEVIAEIETDKAVMELESFSEGILLEQRVHAGNLVPVGTVIGLVGDQGETVAPAQPAPAPQPQAKPPAPAEPAAVAIPTEIITTAGTAELAAPVVRRRARELGIDLAQLQGSGPGGRVTLDDLTQAAASIQTPPPLEPEMSAPDTRKTQPLTPDEQPLTPMRSAIARSVSRSWDTIPHCAVSIDVAMDAAEELRRELKESGGQLSVNDLVIKGATMALRSFPLVNASFGTNRIIKHRDINIGIAVSLADGLLVPVIRNCDKLALQDIAIRSKAVAERARNGQLTADELSGGTFSVTNLGMFGVTAFAAVIHPEQGGILAVGAVRDTVVIKNNAPAAGRVMTLTLSVDHRLVDGAYAAGFLSHLKHTLENPVHMLL